MLNLKAKRHQRFAGHVCVVKKKKNNEKNRDRVWKPSDVRECAINGNIQYDAQGQAYTSNFYPAMSSQVGGVLHNSIRAACSLRACLRTKKKKKNVYRRYTPCLHLPVAANPEPLDQPQVLPQPVPVLARLAALRPALDRWRLPLGPGLFNFANAAAHADCFGPTPYCRNGRVGLCLLCCGESFSGSGCALQGLVETD